MTTVREAAAVLAGAGVPNATHDARVLAHHAAGGDADLDTLVAARAARVPLQHLVGSTGFRYLDLDVGPGVFVPRPETELLVDEVLAAIRDVDRPLVVDLCAGSGAIGLSVAHEHPTVAVHLVERAGPAYQWLAHNCARLLAVSPGSAARIVTHHADLADAPADADGSVDVVVANPPYVPLDERDLVEPEVRDHDPAEAVWAEDGGLAVIRRVVARAVVLLRPGGRLVVEHSERHEHPVPDLLREAGYVDVASHRDLAGRPRYCTAGRPC
jgi:release factor glutamine methyltransferase